MLERAAMVEVAGPGNRRPDIILVHAGLVENESGAGRWSEERDRIVVACAPNNPAYLASLLASGFPGYHCVGEPRDVLIDVIRRVHRGEARADPMTMNQLLMMYRRLLQQSRRNAPNGPAH